MNRRNIVVSLILIFVCVTAWYVYDEITNWGGLGEIIRYLILGLPISITLLFLSHKNLKYTYSNKKIVSIAGFISAFILAIPPTIIYYFFLR